MTREKKLRDLREESEELSVGINAGQTQEFMDWLSPEEQAAFEAMKERAENKKKWLRLYDKMMTYISQREFAAAEEIFETLHMDMELF